MSRWAVITGEKGHGRSAFVREAVEDLKKRGIRVAGFVQLRTRDAHGNKCFELLRVATGEQAVLAVEGVAAKGDSQEAFCTYAFRNDVFDQARGWLEADLPAAEVIVLDDISKMETQGRGHARSVRMALSHPDKVVLISARASQLFYVMENFALADDPLHAVELPAGARERARLVRDLIDAVR